MVLQLQLGWMLVLFQSVWHNLGSGCHVLVQLVTIGCAWGLELAHERRLAILFYVVVFIRVVAWHVIATLVECALWIDIRPSCLDSALRCLCELIVFLAIVVV